MPKTHREQPSFQFIAMPPSQNPELKEISQRIAHLIALLEIPRPNSETSPLWIEYRNLKARRKALEDTAKAEAKAESKGRKTAAPDVRSITGSHTKDEPDDTQGIVSVTSPGLQI